MEAFISWLGTYGQIIGFFIQLIYYLGLVIAAFWAVLLFKRLVDYTTGGGTRPAATVGAEPADEEGSTNVDDFVD